MGAVSLGGSVPFSTSHSASRTKRIILDRARAELKHEMNQPDHQLHEQYVYSLAIFNKVEAAASGSLSHSSSVLEGFLPLSSSLPS